MLRLRSHRAASRTAILDCFVRRIRTIAVAALLSMMSVGFPTTSANASTGSFHTTCGLASVSNDDPIVYPNQPGVAMQHDFFGNRSANAFSTLSSLLLGGTACNVSADTSAYWAPTLIAPNGAVVVPQRMTAYYYRGDIGRANVMPFPAGLKIIAGGDTRNLKVAGYNCGEGVPVSSVPLNCGRSQLKAVIIFPSCWDGRNTDSRDHRRHMAYPTGRGCPRGYPVHVPKLVLHIRYPITDGRGYYLSSDAGANMTNGMSLHADFFNAWNQSTLAQLVQNCLNGSGGNCANS